MCVYCEDLGIGGWGMCVYTVRCCSLDGGVWPGAAAYIILGSFWLP